ncbi:MAG: CinA family protein [Gammaproteobacteria bacterium]
MQQLAENLGKILVQRNQAICTAESCTGGGIANLITAIPGSSDWFDRAYVTYSNQAKISMLGVKAATLEQYGAVSEQVAREMVLGALGHSGTDLAVSVTGVAGPGGGTPQKPVGMVCFACSDGDTLKTATEHFQGDRAAVRAASVKYAIEMLLALVS